MTEWWHPALVYLTGAGLIGIGPRRLGRAVLVVVPLAGIALVVTLPEGARVATTVMGEPLIPLRVDRLARAFAVIFAVIGGLATLYGGETGGRRLHAAGFVATASAIGIAFAGDWVTFYTAWELLALSSFVLIADGGMPAHGAAFRYLMVHAVGGALLLAGTIGHIAKGGGSEVGRLDASGPGLLVLLGFMVNAAVPPLHAWLTDAYPESSPGAGVLLSAFATKSAVYALARVYPGESILVIAGVTMALYGVVFAALENDIRRLLSYHIVSQVGYMVTGVGLGSALALNGAVAHAMAHILYKGLLFMAAGAVIYATDRRGLSTLGGLAGALPATLTLYMVGALAISGAPLLNGFVSKSLTVAAAHAEGRWGVEWLLMLAAVGTFLSVGLKLPVLAFGGPPAAAPARPVAPGMLAAMTVTAVLCAVTGSAPSLLYAWLPFEMSYRPYSSAHVFESLQVLAGTALGFLLARRWIVASAGRTLDFDRLYRVVGAGLVIRAGRAAAAGANRLEAVVGSLVSMPLGRAAAVSRPVGYAILIILAVLALGLVIPLGL